MDRKYNNVCQKILYKLENGEYIKTNKKKFETLEDAIKECKRINSSGKNIDRKFI